MKELLYPWEQAWKIFKICFLKLFFVKLNVNALLPNDNRFIDFIEIMFYKN